MIYFHKCEGKGSFQKSQIKSLQHSIQGRYKKQETLDFKSAFNFNIYIKHLLAFLILLFNHTGAVYIPLQTVQVPGPKWHDLNNVRYGKCSKITNTKK